MARHEERRQRECEGEALGAAGDGSDPIGQPPNARLTRVRYIRAQQASSVTHACPVAGPAGGQRSACIPRGAGPDPRALPTHS
jgi:hypothetical protein